MNFKRNEEIDAQFFPRMGDSLASLDALMKQIDAKCEKPDGPISDKIIELWKSGRYSDFTIIVGEKKFKVHKTILSMQSSVLAKIIENNSEATEIKLDEFSQSDVEALLQFIYTGEVYEGGNTMNQFSIAQKFQVGRMKAAYKQKLRDELDNSNAFDIYMLAHRHSVEGLKRSAVETIGSMFEESLTEELTNDPEKLKKWIGNRHGNKKSKG